MKAAILSLLASLAVYIQAADQKLKLTFATIVPEGMSYHLRLQEMADRWKNELGGAKVIIYAGGATGGEPDMIRRMRVAGLDGALVSAIGLSEIDPYLGALQYVPMLFETWEEVDYVRDQIGPVLEKRLADKGFVLLFWADGGWVRFFSTAPASTPDLLKKLKLFVSTGSGSQAELMKSLGYRPVRLDTKDILVSLQSGLIDVAVVPPFIANAQQHNTVAKYMLDLKWAPIVGGCILRKETWDKFSPAQKARLKEAAEEAGRQIRGRGREEDELSIAAMQKRQLNVVKPSAAELEQWRKVKPELHAAIRGTLLPADLFDLVLKHHSEYRSKLAAK